MKYPLCQTARRFLCSTALCAIAAAIPLHAAQAGPEDGIVLGGSANISSSGSTTTINQSSDRALIRWGSFDIDTMEHVQFNQPSSGSITVNRITDSKASRIDGRLSANGNIVLINPNGVVFGATSVVDVGSLIATSTDLEDDSEFLSGGAVKFARPGNADARIINNGTMTVRDAGLVGLVAPHVENHGVIEARVGNVQLASGNIHTIDFAGDGLIKLEVSDNVIAQSVVNTGTIIADGGAVLMTAAQARHVVDALIENTGTIQANTVNSKTGSIKLSTRGLDNTTVMGQDKIINSGTLMASGQEDNTQGGTITVLASAIDINDGSIIDVLGDSGGGTISIGGAYQGGSSLPTSGFAYIGQGALLNASSRRRGNGGQIILWSDSITEYYGHATARGGAESGDGGFIEVSGKSYLDYDGTVDLGALQGAAGTLLLDPTNITISGAADQNISGTSPYAPNADDATSILNITTLLSALASGNVIVQTRATGAQAGNITVDSAINWGSGNTLTLDAHNQIIVNSAITGANLHMISGGDVALNANISGTGTLTIEQRSDAITLGLGDAAAGTLHLSATEIGRIQDGWSDIIIGRQTATAAMNLRALTWNDNLTLRSGTGVITVAATQNLGANNLAFITDGDIALNVANSLAGTGNLSIQQANAATTIGLSGGAGVINLTATETARITNGWNEIIIGRIDGTGAITSATATWNDVLTLQSGTGTINITGVQTMGANNLNFITDGDVNLSAVANILFGTGTLTFNTVSAGTGIGLGDGQVGALNLTSAEIGRIRNGWGNIIFGRTDGTGAVNVGATTWNDYLTLQSGTGAMNINGALTMAANNYLTIVTDADLLLAGALTGSITSSNTAVLTVRQASNNVGMGLGDGQAGTLHLSNAELALINDGWTSRVFGRTDSIAALNVGTNSWVDPLTLQTGSGQMNINGAQVMGGNAITLRTDSNVAILDNITGTGSFSLIQASAGTSMGIGSAQAGAVHLDDTELARLNNTFSTRLFGRTDGTAALNFAGGTAPDPLNLRTGTGALNIDGALIMGANNLTISTDSDLAINANMTGTGTLTISGSAAATSMGVGTGQAGDLVLDDTELSRLGTTWAAIVLGSLTAAGDMNVGSRTWSDPLTLRTGSGALNINGNIAMGGNALALTTNSNLALGGNLTGTGTLTISGSAAATSIGVGDAQGGSLLLSDAELGRIQDGWGSIVIGATTQTGSINVGGYNWADPLSLVTAGTLNINGPLDMAGNNLTFRTASNIAVNDTVTGTGVLTVYSTSNSTTMGIGDGQAGTLSLDNNELSRIASTWTNVIFGTTSLTGAMNISARAWDHSVEFRTSSGALNINGAQNMGAKNLTIRTNTNLAISSILAGTGNISIMTSGVAAANTMGIGTGQTGQLQLNNTELGFIADGWNNIILGNVSSVGAMNVGAYSWNDNLILRHLGDSSNALNINGIQNLGSNNLTLQTGFDLNLGHAINGTGNLTIAPALVTTTMGIGAGQAGSLAINDTELGRITNGWSSVTLGSTTMTGAMNVGTYSWNDDLSLITSTGIVTIGGALSMGANDLTIQTSGNLALNNNISGTGALTIMPTALNTAINLNATATGLNITDAEMNRIVDGWSDIIIGRSDGTGAFSVMSRTWNDNLTLRSGAGLMTIAGAAMGANDLTLMTNSNLAITGNLSGTGNLQIRNASGVTGIGVGTGQAGVLVLDNAELGRLVDGWNTITIGDAQSFGTINIGTNTWADAVSFITQGDIVLNGDQTSIQAGAGTNLVFATLGGIFDNNAGSDAINAGSGRFLVYSIDENNDDLDGLLRSTIITNESYASYGPGSVIEAGNVFIYSGVVAKILFLTIDDIDKIYGDGLPTFTYSYVSGLQNGDLLGDVILSYSMNAVGATTLDSAGTTRVITGSFGLDLGYTLNLTTGTMTVVKAPLTVTADSDTRQYGLANPALTLSYSGFKNGEDENDLNSLSSASTAATIFSDVGSYAITASGGTADNYDLIYVDGDLAITKAVLTATMQNATREYGDANSLFTANYSGFRNGDTSAVIDTLAGGTTVANNLSNVGTYTISGTGALDNNYSFNYVNGTLTVTKATLVATADNQTREYGLANPVLTTSYTGFKNGETSAVIDILTTASTAATMATGVGSYTITTAGASDSNYDFSYTNGSLDITKALLTVTANDASRTYGDANPALGVSYSGFRNGETLAALTTGASASTFANALSNAGTYAITAAGAVADNYDFSYVNGALTVNKAALNATAGNGTREYGDTNPAFSVTYAGFRNGDDETDITTLASAVSAPVTANAGTYAVIASGGFDDNYTFNYIDGILTVTKALLTATANDSSREQGATNPSFSVSYTGFKNADAASVIDTPVSVTTLADSLSPIGTYLLTAGGGFDNNYNFIYVDGLLTINPVSVAAPLQDNSFVIPSTVNNALNNPNIYYAPNARYEAQVTYKNAPEYVFVNDEELFGGTYVFSDALIVVSESLQDWVY